ncbi:unnamed protein product [Paramecium sonneborni]|uniref:Uncharacterized protein n=1 Tax=Paramecium sonneborni TaxID=65129 RepID=A0A8S1Q8Y6_9CILI|nr:unnamed protein product [Paramecium sonneborni]
MLIILCQEMKQLFTHELDIWKFTFPQIKTVKDLAKNGELVDIMINFYPRFYGLEIVRQIYFNHLLEFLNCETSARKFQTKLTKINFKVQQKTCEF